MKSPTSMEHIRDTPRWPVSPRLRSPPPMLQRPSLGSRRSTEVEATPLINVQRATPQQPPAEGQSDTDVDDGFLPAGMRTPARGGGGSTSTLETVQEVSPIGSPKRVGESMEEKLEESMLSETSQAESVIGLGLSRKPTTSSTTTSHATQHHRVNESGSESEYARNNYHQQRRSVGSIVPSLTRRQSSTRISPGIGRSKTGEMQSMTVETETVTSIPQAPLVPAIAAQTSSTSLRRKQSTETIRPKKEKRKTRRQPVNGEQKALPYSRLRHHQSLGSVVPSAADKGALPARRHRGEMADGRLRRQHGRASSLSLYQMSTLLTRQRLVSSKADIFEAKVASAVEEANSSDSEETFVYDSNPPDGRERPLRFHSRTPSATSMASQYDRGMRSIHAVMMESDGPPPMLVKKSMKFSSNSNNLNNDLGIMSDDGRVPGRSNVGSARGTPRHHNQHFNRWARNGGYGATSAGNGHPSVFAEHSPFTASQAVGNVGSRQPSAPPSPRYGPGRGFWGNGKRGAHLLPGYDFDDTTTGADDETTPLIPSSIRPSRYSRNRRGHSLRSIESQQYRSPPSVLNRFASCLVLTVMLLLVVSGVIGFMFATSQPLTDIELVSMDHVVASQQELMLDLTIRAHNPNVVVVTVDSADIEVFAKSPHALSDSEWWRHTHPGEIGPPPPRKGGVGDIEVTEATQPTPSPSPNPNQPDDSAPNMRLGTITGFNSALSFEGSFFHKGISYSSGEVRLKNPGNGTYGGPERWERIMEDEFQLILKGVLKYTLPLSQRVRTATISGKTTVKPNAGGDPALKPDQPELPGPDEGGLNGNGTDITGGGEVNATSSTVLARTKRMRVRIKL